MKMNSALAMFFLLLCALAWSSWGVWTSEASEGATSAENKNASSKPPLTLEEARGRAELLHVAMHRTLHAVHQGLYRTDEGLPLPAALLKEVFQDIEKEQQVKLRWLAVDGQAMNADHKPQGEFETKAFAALQAGREVLEEVENGVYRRAGSITLTNVCLKCHVPDRKNTNDRTAGLIIAIPLAGKK